MFQLTKPYTDKHGNIHNHACVVVNRVTLTSQSHHECHAIIKDGTVTYSAPPSAESSTLHFDAVLYKDLAALQAGFEPVQIQTTEFRTGFYISNPASAQTVDEKIALCENFLKTNVFKE